MNKLKAFICVAIFVGCMGLTATWWFKYTNLQIAYTVLEHDYTVAKVDISNLEGKVAQLSQVIEAQNMEKASINRVLQQAYKQLSDQASEMERIEKNMANADAVVDKLVADGVLDPAVGEEAKINIAVEEITNGTYTKATPAQSKVGLDYLNSLMSPNDQ